MRPEVNAVRHTGSCGGQGYGQGNEEETNRGNELGYIEHGPPGMSRVFSTITDPVQFSQGHLVRLV
jgi:hypothetical protein